MTTAQTAPQSAEVASLTARVLESQRNSCGVIHVHVTDDLIAALEAVYSLDLPQEQQVELLCLKVQAMVMREHARKVAS